MIKTFNLERFATHDGDGIRTVIFLKGCALRCPWCSNPESQPLQSTLFFHKKRCIRCGTCEALSNGEITFQNGDLVCDDSKLSHMRELVDQCPSGALEVVGKEEAIENLVHEVLKDKDYYEASGGGVTVSGGEPFTQFPQFLTLIKRLKEEGLNVAVETCGNFPLSHLELADPYIDTYLFDLKHLDAEKYEKVVKGKLEIVLRNIGFIDAQKLVLRVPVIPNFNHDEDTLKAIISFAAHKKAKELHFLPYHLLALDKYEKMRKPYEWTKEKLDRTTLEKYKEYAKQQGVTLKIGG